jgi:hypothetical protein
MCTLACASDVACFNYYRLLIMFMLTGASHSLDINVSLETKGCTQFCLLFLVNDMLCGTF